MTGSKPPRLPAWVRWSLGRLLSERELRLVLDELAELHALHAARDGARRADRRYLRQARQYPFLLVAERLRVGVRVSIPGIRDVVQAGRSLSRVPALSGAVVLTVGIGIGACTAIFSVVDALYFHALPYADAGRLYWVHTDSPPDRWPFSVVDWEALTGQQTSFERLGAYTRSTRTFVTGDSSAMRLLESAGSSEPGTGRVECRVDRVLDDDGSAGRAQVDPTPAEVLAFDHTDGQWAPVRRCARLPECGWPSWQIAEKEPQRRVAGRRFRRDGRANAHQAARRVGDP